MNLVYLPYSDDVRQPEADTTFTGLAHPRADEAQIEAAERLMAALSLPEFASSNIPNPTLQRHYQVFNAQMMPLFAFLVMVLECTYWFSQTAASTCHA